MFYTPIHTTHHISQHHTTQYTTTHLSCLSSSIVLSSYSLLVLHFQLTSLIRSSNSCRVGSMRSHPSGILFLFDLDSLYVKFMMSLCMSFDVSGSYKSLLLRRMPMGFFIFKDELQKRMRIRRKTSKCTKQVMIHQYGI